MGLLGNMMKRVVSHAINDTIDKTSIASKNRSQNDINAFIDVNPSHAHLIVNRRFTWKESFNVVDENNAIKYTVKGEMLSMKHHLHIFDANGKELGVIKEKLFSFRFPLFKENNPVDFEIEVAGKKLGRVKSKWALWKSKFIVDFNGWIIKGDVFGWKYNVYEGEKTILQVTQKILSFDDTEQNTFGGSYFVKIFDRKNELLGLMIALALDAAVTSKSYHFDRTLHHKSGGWM